MAVLLKIHVFWVMTVCQTSISRDLKDFFEQSNKSSFGWRRAHYTMFINVIYSECDLCKIFHLELMDEVWLSLCSPIEFHEKGSNHTAFCCNFCCTVRTVNLALMFVMNFCPDCNTVASSYFEILLVHYPNGEIMWHVIVYVNVCFAHWVSIADIPYLL
jgi:hypothetical protein